MSEPGAIEYESNHGRGSPLFCTPPPELMQARELGESERAEDGIVISHKLDSFSDASTSEQVCAFTYNQEPQIGAEVDTAEEPGCPEGEDNWTQDLWILDPNWLELGLCYGTLEQADNQADQDSPTVIAGTSITCKISSITGGSGHAHSHLTSTDTGKSHLHATVSTVLKHKTPLKSAQSFAHNSNSLRSLPGHLSSKEEPRADGVGASRSFDRKEASEVSKTPRTGKSGGRRPPGKFRSAEFAHSESEGDVEQRGHEQLLNDKKQHRELPTTLQKRCRSSEVFLDTRVLDYNPKSSEAWRKGSSKTPHSLTSMEARIKGKPAKRPAASQATPRKAFKRPKILGGFIDESDGSEDNESVCEVPNNKHISKNEDEAHDQKSIPETPPRPARQISLDQRTAGLRPAPKPANKSLKLARMRMLLKLTPEERTPNKSFGKTPIARAKQVSRPMTIEPDVSFTTLQRPLNSASTTRRTTMSPTAADGSELHSLSKSTGTFTHTGSMHASPGPRPASPLKSKPYTPNKLAATPVAVTRPESRNTQLAANFRRQSTQLETKPTSARHEAGNSVDLSTLARPSAASPISSTSSNPALVGGLLQGIRQSEEVRNAKGKPVLVASVPTMGLPKTATRSPVKSQVNSASPQALSLHRIQAEKHATSNAHKDAAQAKLGDAERQADLNTTHTAEKRHPSTTYLGPRSSSDILRSRDQSAESIASKSRLSGGPRPGVHAANLDKLRAPVPSSNEVIDSAIIEGSNPRPKADSNLSLGRSSATTTGPAATTTRHRLPLATKSVPRSGPTRNLPIIYVSEQVKTTTPAKSTDLPSHRRETQQVGVKSATAIEQSKAAKAIPNNNLQGRKSSAVSVENATKKVQPTPAEAAPAKVYPSFGAPKHQDLHQTPMQSLTGDKHAEVSSSKQDHMSGLPKLTTEVGDHREDPERVNKGNLGGNHTNNISIRQSAQAAESVPNLTSKTIPADDQIVPSANGSSHPVPGSAAKTNNLTGLVQPNAASSVLGTDQAQEEQKKDKEQRQPAEATREEDLDPYANELERPAQSQQAPDSIVQADNQLLIGSPLPEPVQLNNESIIPATCALNQTTRPDTASHVFKLQETRTDQYADPIEKQDLPILLLTTSPNPAAGAEHFFQYTIFQKIWSESASATSASTIECSRSFTCVEEANTQAETHSTSLREQYQQHFQVHFTGWKNEKDGHGCSVLTSTFAPIDIPSKKSLVKVWVKRDYVSAYAGVKPADLPYAPFIAKTVYILRLFKLLKPDTEAEVETETDDGPDTPDPGNYTSKRMYHPLPRTECYTTLDAANRVARDVQIEMSLKPQPNELERIWQEKQLKELHDKVRDLGDEECWRSEFNGAGLGSDKFELVVERAGLCGPRNL
ncbi:hypothetical protein BKA63DRAFT_524702 [Paraphoma chrysanthemicola]|nr:hypothetical protein BKA63DRAFT_524702 [Paraphoma chrysanthemicola]